MKQTILLLSAIFFSSFVISQQTGQIRGVFVGVSNYKYLADNVQLKYADADAVDMYNLFLKYENVKKENLALLINEDAHRDVVFNTLYSMIEESREGDLVVFYFAGHGDVGGKDDDIGFILLNEVTADRTYHASDAILLNDIRDITEIATKKKTKVLIITDACRSGNLISGTVGSDMTLTSLQQEWNNVFKIVSCQPSQLSAESEIWGGGHGIFTYHLVNALSGLADENKDNKLKFVEVFDYVKSNVKTETELKQIPKATGDESNDLFNVNLKTKSERELILKKNKPIKYKLESLMKESKQNYVNTTNEIHSELLNNFQKALSKDVLIRPSNNKLQKKDIYFGKTVDFRLNSRSYDIKFSPDGRHFACVSEDGKIVYSTTEIDAKVLTSINIQAHKEGALSVSFSKDGKYIASGSWDQTIKVFEIASISESKDVSPIANISIHTNDVRSLEFSPDNKILASGGDTGDSQVLITNLLSWGLDDILYKHKGRVNVITFSKNGDLLASGAEDGEICVYLKSKSFKDGYKFTSKTIINDLKFLSDSVIISADKSGQLKFWKLRKNEKTPFKTINFQTEIKNIVIAKNKYIIVALKTGLIKVYDIEKGNITDIQTQILGEPLSFDINPQNNLIAFSTLSNTIGFIEFIVPEIELSYATEIYEQIITNPETEYLKSRVKCLLTTRIQYHAQNIIETIVRGSNVLPSMRELEKTIIELDYCLKLYDTTSVLFRRIKAKKLLASAQFALISGDVTLISSAYNTIEEIKRLEPTAAYLYDILSQLYAKQKKLEKAKENIDIALGKLPNCTSFLTTKGKNLALEGKYDEAIKIFKDMTVEKPDSATGYTELALIYTLQGQFEKALQNFDSAIVKSKKDPFILNMYGNLLYKKGNFNIAIQQYNKAKEANKTYQNVYIDHAKILIENGNTVLAEYQFNQSAKNDNDNPVWFYEKAMFEFCRGNINLSLQLLDTCQKMYPSYHKAYMGKAKIYYYLYKNIQKDKLLLLKTVENFEEALKLPHYDYEPYMLYAEVLLSTLQDSKTVEHFSIIPEFEKFYNKESLLKNKVFIKIDELYNSAEKLNPFSPELQFSRSLYLYETGKDKTFSILKSKELELSGFYKYNYLLGKATILTMGEKEALKLYKKAEEQNKYFLPAFMEITTLYEKNGEEKKAIKLNEKLRDERVFTGSPILTIELLKNKEKPLISDYSAILRIDPNLTKAKIAEDNIKFIQKKNQNEKEIPELNMVRENVCQNNTIIVSRFGKYGLMNFNGELLITCDYDEIICNDNNIDLLIDGKIVEKKIFDDLLKKSK